MASDKLEPRLVTFIEQQKVRASAARAAAAAVDDVPLDVTISHHDRIRASGEGKAAQVDELQGRVRQSQQPILDKLKALRAPEPTVHSLTNAVTTRLTPRQLEEVAELDEVKIIRHEAVEYVELMQDSVRTIEATEAQEDFGADGRDITVAILDSGIDKNHPALLGKVVDEISTSGEAVAIPGNHGTHVAGTVASNDPVHRGVAPMARLINIKVLTAAGFGAPANVIQGLEQAVRRGARVANLSLGWSEVFHGWVCNDADCILCQAADNASRLGVTVVVAAGNEGNAGAKPPFAIRHPGAARRVITVGAVDKAKVLAPFSSLGPSSGRLSPGSALRLTKPDLSAPGVAIMSSVLGGGFAAFNGTSMASPHVAGLVALVLQRNPRLLPRMVKKLLEDSCEPVPFAPNQVGYGVINAYSALLRATGTAAVATT
jgi:subtilisin family serine protease